MIRTGFNVDGIRNYLGIRFDRDAELVVRNNGRKL